MDDEQFNIDALKIMLMYHCNIATIDICDSAFNGEEALQAVINNVEKNQGLSCDYELILMDLNMPIMDGNESAHLIRSFLHKSKLKQPIISAITGHSERSYALKAISSGVNQVLSKPVSPTTIKKLLERFPFKKAS